MTVKQVHCKSLRTVWVHVGKYTELASGAYETMRCPVQRSRRLQGAGLQARVRYCTFSFPAWLWPCMGWILYPWYRLDSHGKFLGRPCRIGMIVSLLPYPGFILKVQELKRDVKLLSPAHGKRLTNDFSSQTSLIMKSKSKSQKNFKCQQLSQLPQNSSSVNPK